MVAKNLRKGLAGVVTGVLLVAGMVIMTPSAKAAEDVNITFPSDRGVFQRDANNAADISVRASYEGADTLKVRVEENGVAVSEWVAMQKGENEYTAVIPGVKAGGWYQLVAASFDSAGAETSKAEIEHIGVGEVFITGGQSNSINFGGEKTECESDYVSAYDAKNDVWQHCEDSQPSTSDFNTGNGGGSPWPTLGDALYDELGVPIGFVASGRGSAKISELADTSESGMYKYIKTAIDKIKPYGCKAFLMHQGEADTNDTPNDEYLADLKKLIEQARTDMGYDINWFVAQVSYAWNGYNNKEKMDAMKATQRAACNNYNIFVGPETDDLQGEYRHTDNLHLSKLGLIEHGKRWAEVLMSKLYTAYSMEAETSMVHGKIDQAGKGLFAGNTIKLTATADEGYYYVQGSAKVTTESGEELPVTDDSFVMCAENVKVTADFAALPAHFASLLQSIKAAEAINQAEYEAAGLAVLKTAVDAGKKVYANASATETETSKAKTDIDNAVKALVKKAVQSPAPGATPVPGTNVQKDLLPSKGKEISVGNIRYVITESTDKKKTVSVLELVKKNITSVVIPKSIKISGRTYNVTAISKEAFKGAAKLKKITIKASGIKKIGKDAFAKIHSKARIKVPSGKLKAYKRLIKKSGFKKISAVRK